MVLFPFPDISFVNFWFGLKMATVNVLVLLAPHNTSVSVLSMNNIYAISQYTSL